MGAILATVIAVAVVVAALVAWSGWLRSRMQRRRHGAAARAGGSSPVRLGDRAVAVLDIEGAPADSPALRRLVQEQAAAVFASMPDVKEVEIRTPSGVVLGTRTRAAAGGPGPVSIPAGHVRHVGPDVTRHLARTTEAATIPTQHWEEGPAQVVSPRRFVERFELPERAMALVGDGDDPVDVVRALLAASGYEPVVDGDTVAVPDVVVVVLSSRDGVIDPDSLGHAFLRVEAAGASRGVVIMLGFADPEDVRHREVVAPHVLHVGPRAVQRMADAVALGADPLQFAVLSAGARGRHEHATA